MKRKFYTILILLCIISTFAALTGCKKMTNLEKIENNVSIRQTALFAGDHQDFEVKLSTTTQEELFIADGKVGNMVTNNKINLMPTNASLLNKNYTFSLVGETGKIDGTLEKAKLGTNFVAYINDINNIGAISKIVITYDEVDNEIQLTNKLAETIDSAKALEVAYETFKDKIDASLDSKNFNREIYIKVVEHNLSENNYYWFVSFIASKEDYWSVLIDMDGQVLNSKIMSPAEQN